MSEKTYEVESPSGRKWVLRPLPKHFFLYFGELPTVFTEIVAKHSNDENIEGAAQEAMSRLSPKEQTDAVVFIREAVNYACVSPKIKLHPKAADEISPFEVSEEDFSFLSAMTLSGHARGGLAKGLKSFRGERSQNAVAGASGAKLRKTSKRTAKKR